MANKTDDVLQMLNELGEQTPRDGPRPPGSSATSDKYEVAQNEDIIGFLDSLAGQTESTQAAPQGQTAVSGNQAGPAKGESKDRASPDNQKVTSKSQDAKQSPQETGRSWWNKSWISARVKDLQPELEQLGQLNKLKLDTTILQSTLSTVLDTLVLPIASQEQLNIHVFHDMLGYGSVDRIVHSVFDKVMQQVEGGATLHLVVQKGKERARRGSYGAVNEQRCLGLLRGSVQQGRKLAAANIDDFLRDHTTQPHTNEHVSDIFISLQPVAAEPAADAIPTPVDGDNLLLAPQSCTAFYFVIHLTDPEHKISLTTTSQPFPLTWAEWLDATDEDLANFVSDPREWALEWVEQGLGLAVGVVAQAYVARRMGLGL